MIKLISVCACLLLCACAVPYPETPAGFTEKTIETKRLQFQVWEHITQENSPIRIYIEGSGNPTPKHPVALDLAAKDSFPNVIYISQPCQYITCEPCKNPLIWTEERFNEEIIVEFRRLITYLAQKYQATGIEIVGYDSGATIACLLADQLPIARLITVGGILDTEAYASAQHITLNGQNPIRMMAALSSIPQVHYVAEYDDITPRSIAEQFVNKLHNPPSAGVKLVGDATHTDWTNLTLD